jgi:hypothetical protein
VIDVSVVCGFDGAAQAAPGPRHPGEASAQRFRELLDADPCPVAGPTAAPQPGAGAGLQQALDLNIEKVLMANLPAHDASPAEFAIGMLRAQVAVSQAAVGIELLAKTSQSLTQGVQSLTARG